jgi:hypothetical protein
LKRDFRILTEIGNLLYKEKNMPALTCLASAGHSDLPLLTVFSPEHREAREQKIEKNLNKNNFSPLSIIASPSSGKEKGSFLNKKTYDYLNSVSPKNLRCNLNEQKVASIKTSLCCPPHLPEARGLKINDVIYQYLKTFSLFNKRKNGILIKYNQQIGYNFNSRNILLRGVEPKIVTSTVANKSLKPNKNIINHYYLNGPLLKKEPKINKEIAKELNRLKGVSGLTGYNRSSNNRLIKYSYKLLFYFFKSMYCLISKPVFLFTPDKVTIQLFYYLNIPKFKVFKWYSILNNKLIRQKWYSLTSTTFARAKASLATVALLEPAVEAREVNKLSNISIPSDTEHTVADPLNHGQLNGHLIGNANLTSKKLKTVLYSNKEMMNCLRQVKLSWRIKKTLFRLNKKRNKVKHILFNLNKYNLFKVFSFKFKLICEILSNKFKKPVELQLIKIHQPFHDSNILVNLLSLNIRNKKFKTNVAIEKLYAKKAVKNLYDYSNNSVNFIPTFLSGIKIRIGGRLMREPIIPRITTKNFERGASSPGKVNFLDTATITKKNRKGSYTIKISSGQNFF